MLRGTTSAAAAALSLEQSTDATGAVQQVKQIQPLIITDRVLIQDTQATVDVEGIALAAAQLYPFVTEKAPSPGGGGVDEHVPQLEPLEATRLYQDELDAEKRTSNVELPLDPLDPTWGRPSDRDRTLNAAADFGVPSRLLLQNNNNNEKSIAMLSGVSAITTMAAESDILQQQFPMLLVGGLVAFMVAGVVVNRARRSSGKNKQKALDDVVFDDDEEDGDNDEGYALFS